MRWAWASVRSKPAAVSFVGNRGKRFVGLGKVAFARPGGGALQRVGQAVRLGVRFLDGLFVLHPRLRLVSHQRIGVPQAELRVVEIGIDFQRRLVVLDGGVEVARHAQDFGIRILRIGQVGKRRHIALHGFEGLGILAALRIAIAQIVQGRRIILVDGQRPLQRLLRLLVAVLPHHPVSRQVGQALVFGKHFQQVVHAGNGGDEIIFLCPGNPLDQQAFSGRGFGGQQLGLFPRRVGFRGIVAVVGDKNIGHREVGISLDRRPPADVGPLQIEVLVVGERAIEQVPGLGRRRGHRHRLG